MFVIISILYWFVYKLFMYNGKFMWNIIRLESKDGSVCYINNFFLFFRI